MIFTELLFRVAGLKCCSELCTTIYHSIPIKMVAEVVLDIGRGNNFPVVPRSAPPSATTRSARKPSQEVSRAWEYHELHMLRREVNDLRRNVKNEGPARTRLEACILFAVIIVFATIAIALYVSYPRK